LSVERRFGDFKLSLSGDLGSDRYFNTDADADEIVFDLRAAYSPDKAMWSIYAGYRSTLDFLPTFEHLDRTLHDITVGAMKTFVIKAGEKDIKVDIEAKVARRESDVATSISTAGTVNAKLSYTLTKEWSATVKPQLEVRGFDEKVGGTSRVDERVSVLTSLKWRPEWLPDFVFIAFEATFVKRFSNVERARFSQWEAGPSANFQWSF
jgi:hypothetical protein